jgi:hypothetical protein
MSEQQSEYAGWAILEIFGHQKYAGYVTTQTFGMAVLFRCDVPPLPERERVTRSGCYVSDDKVDAAFYAPAGSTVKESATPGYSKFFGVGALFSMTPCDEAAALRAVEELQPRALMLVSLPAEKALGAGAPENLPPIFDVGAYHCEDCHKPLDLCSCPEEDDPR